MVSRKTIIAGSRNITDFDVVEQAFIDCPWKISEIVSGKAKGVDHLGEMVAHKYRIRLSCFPADWAKNGRAAGPIRNSAMADYAEGLILIWDGQSRGSANMLSTAKKKGLTIFEVILKE